MELSIFSNCLLTFVLQIGAISTLHIYVTRVHINLRYTDIDSSIRPISIAYYVNASL